MELNHSVAVFYNVHNLSNKKSFTEYNSCTGSCFLTGLYKTFPYIIRITLKQQNFYSCTRIFLNAHKSGWNYRPYTLFHYLPELKTDESEPISPPLGWCPGRGKQPSV